MKLLEGRLEGRFATGALGVMLLLAAWEFGARALVGDERVLPAPTQCLLAAWRQLSALELAQHIGTSLGRIAFGFALAALAGITLGVCAGWYAGFGRLARPLVDLLRPIPPLAWIPMAIVWFGLGEPSKWFVIFLGAFFPVFTNSLRGMTAIAPVLLDAARTMDARGPELLLRVAVPAALPDIATGLRVGLGLAFGILVAAELIAASSGVGFLVMRSRELGQLGVAIFAVIVIGLMSLTADAALAAALRRGGYRGALD
jgi:ABC-type nitrate/sulfonate/bicarbonate transport system permease component